MSRTRRPSGLLALAPALLLVACDSPDPRSDFARVPPSRVEIAGSTFAVRVAGNRARSVRTDFDPQAGFGAAILPRAGLAMERVSGCRVVAGTLAGDASVAEARLRC